MINNDGREYVLGPKSIEENIILITGTSRAGKTLLSKVLATYKNVEWIEEPYELLNLTIMCGLGLIEKDIFRMLFTSSVHELIVNNILLRNGNFRPGDLSSIWNYKSGVDIFHRLESLSSRADVANYIAKEKPYFILDIPDILPFTGLIREVCDNLTIVNVVRDPYAVADDCYRKGWFAADDKQLADNNLFRVYDGHRLPWWVREGEEENFIKSTVYEKGLMYWLAVQSWETDEVSDKNKYDILVRYEDITGDIDGVLDNISSVCKIIPTTITNGVKSEIRSDFCVKEADIDRDISIIDLSYLQSVKNRFVY